jgi:hypothetical protein
LFLQVMLIGGGALDPGREGKSSCLWQPSSDSSRLGLRHALQHFHRIFGGVLLQQFMSRLLGGVVGGGGVRGWQLDEVTMLNPSLATCLNV